jgi:hypothetical protein
MAALLRGCCDQSTAGTPIPIPERIHPSLSGRIEKGIAAALPGRGTSSPAKPSPARLDAMRFTPDERRKSTAQYPRRILLLGLGQPAAKYRHIFYATGCLQDKKGGTT